MAPAPEAAPRLGSAECDARALGDVQRRQAALNAAATHEALVRVQGRLDRRDQRALQSLERAWRRDLARRTADATLERRPPESAAANRGSHAHRRGPRRRTARTTASASGRRSRGVARPDDSEPPAAACAGCGASIPAASSRQRYCSAACGNASRQRAWYDRHRRVEPSRAPAYRVVVADAAELRARVGALAERRLALWLALPSANGDGLSLRAELEALEDEIARGWDAIRTAEAVPR